jgi:hypothetical protein
MALWPIKNIGPMTWLYGRCDTNGCPATDMCTPPLEYCDRFTTGFGGWRGLINFFYYPTYDCFFIPAVFDCHPSISAGGYFIGYLVLDPETGQRRTEIEQSLAALPSVISGSIWNFLSTKSVEAGSYGKVFVVRTFIFSTSIFEVDPGSLEAIDGGWSIDTGTLPNYPSEWVVDGPDGAIVNITDDYLAIVGASMVREGRVWKNVSGTPEYLGAVPVPADAIYDVAYENEQYFWVSMAGGYLMKVDYKNVRVEFFSQLPDVDADDRRYLIAWDQLRGRLAVLRQKTDDPTTGACRCTLEFYRPIGKAALLSDPVPVNSLRAGKHIPFIFHLLGTAGEPIAPYTIQAALDTPAKGALLSGFARSGVGGMGTVEYQASMVTGQDTLQLQATIADGE